MTTCQFDKDGTPREYRADVLRTVAAEYIPVGALNDKTYVNIQKAMSKSSAHGVAHINNDYIWKERMQGNTFLGKKSYGEAIDFLVQQKYGSRDLTVYPEQLMPAQIDEIAADFRSLLMKDAMLPEPGRVVGAIDTLGRLGSETLLLNSLNLPRQVVGNVVVGSATQQLVSGHFESAAVGLGHITRAGGETVADRALRLLRLRKGRSQLDFSYGYGHMMEETGAVDPEIARQVRFYESDPMEGEGVIAFAKTTKWGQVYGKPRAGLERAMRAMYDDLPESPIVKRALDVMEGSLMALGPLEAATIRKVGSASESIIRNSAFATHYNKLWREGVPIEQRLQRERFLKTIQDTLGEDPEGARYLNKVFDDVYAGMGPRYRPVELRTALETTFYRDTVLGIHTVDQYQLFKKATNDLVDQHMEWMDEIISEADRTRNMDLFDWEERKIDVWAGRYMPFGRFYIRYIPFALRTAKRHPALTVSYIEMNNQMAEHADAEGWPDFMRNYIKLTSGPFGSALMLNPFAAFGLMGMAWMMDKTPDHLKRNRFQDFLQNTVMANGVTPAPHWFWAFPLQASGLMGEQGRVAYPIEQMFGLRLPYLGINLFNAYVRRSDPIAPPGRDLTNWFAEQFSAMNPVGSDLELASAGASMESKIQQMMIQLYREEKGWSYEYYIGLQAEWLRSQDPTQVGINWQAVEDYDMMSEELIPGWENEDGRFYEEAFEKVMDVEAARGTSLMSFFSIWEDPKGGLALAAVSGSMGGPVATSQTSEDLSEGAGAYVPPWRVVRENTALMQKLEESGIDPHKFYDQAYYTAEVYQEELSQDTSTPESRALVSHDAAYTAIGGAKGQEVFDTYYAILYGNSEEDLTLEGITFTPEMLSALTDYGREALATKYLESVPDGQATIDAISAARQIMAESNPEYNLYLKWKEDVERWRTYGGFKTYRRLVCAENQGQCEYYEQMKQNVTAAVASDSTIPVSERAAEIEKRMNSGTTGIKAYMAAYGIVYDTENTFDTGDLGKQPALPAAAAAESAEGKTGTPGVITVERVNAAIADMELYESAANGYLIDKYGYDLGGVLPLHAGKIIQELALNGIMPPADSMLAEDYESYVSLATSTGVEPTVDGYVKFMANGNFQTGEWNMKREFHQMPGGWGFWTGPRGNDPIYVQPQMTGGAGLSYSDPTQMGQAFPTMDQQQATGLYGVGIEDPYPGSLNVAPTGTGQIQSQGINRSTSMGQRLGSLARTIGSG